MAILATIYFVPKATFVWSWVSKPSDNFYYLRYNIRENKPCTYLQNPVGSLLNTLYDFERSMQSAISPLSLRAKTSSKKQFLVNAICYMAVAYCSPAVLLGPFAYRRIHMIMCTFMSTLVNMRLDLTMYNSILYKYIYLSKNIII